MTPFLEMMKETGARSSQASLYRLEGTCNKQASESDVTPGRYTQS